MPSATTPAQTRHKTVPPSPLSQSTSAVYLQPSQAHVPTDPLKLTKPRKPVLDTSLHRAPESNNPVPQSLSLPTTPNRTPSPSKPGSDFIAGRPYSAQQSPTHRKERRTSLLGRLARKFSLLRKPLRSEDEDDWHHVDTNETKPDRLVRPKHSSPANMRAERAKSFERVADPIRPPTFRVVPPPPPDPGSPYNEDPPSHTERRRPSQMSLDPPLSLGRLTITNPDEPYGEDASTLMQHIPPLSGVMDDREPKIPVPPKDDAPPPPPPRDQPPEPDASPLLPPPPLPSIYPASPLSAQTIPSDIDLPWPPSPANLNAAESSHRSATPQTHKRTESIIPFPLSSNGSLPEIPSLLSPPPRLAAFPLLGTESPLSTASLLVNPPTPHPPEMSIPATPAPNVSAPAPAPAPAPTRPPYETRRSSQDRQGNGVVRQTETFKLVRSSSGTIHPAGEKIVVAGHEWEVVESDAPKRSKTKDKLSKSRDREGGSGREHRHRERAKADAVDATSQRRMSQRHEGMDDRPIPLRLHPQISLTVLGLTVQTRDTRHAILAPNLSNIRTSRVGGGKRSERRLRRHVMVGAILEPNLPSIMSTGQVGDEKRSACRLRRHAMAKGIPPLTRLSTMNTGQVGDGTRSECRPRRHVMVEVTLPLSPSSTRVGDGKRSERRLRKHVMVEGTRLLSLPSIRSTDPVGGEKRSERPIELTPPRHSVVRAILHPSLLTSTSTGQVEDVKRSEHLIASITMSNLDRMGPFHSTSINLSQRHQHLHPPWFQLPSKDDHRRQPDQSPNFHRPQSSAL